MITGLLDFSVVKAGGPSADIPAAVVGSFPGLCLPHAIYPGFLSVQSQ